MVNDLFMKKIELFVESLDIDEKKYLVSENERLVKINFFGHQGSDTFTDYIDGRYIGRDIHEDALKLVFLTISTSYLVTQLIDNPKILNQKTSGIKAVSDEYAAVVTAFSDVHGNIKAAVFFGISKYRVTKLRSESLGRVSQKQIAEGKYQERNLSYISDKIRWYKDRMLLDKSERNELLKKHITLESIINISMINSDDLYIKSKFFFYEELKVITDINISTKISNFCEEFSLELEDLKLRY